MKVKNYLWTFAAALALVGCSDDLENQKGEPDSGSEAALGETYVSFTIAQPETKAPRPSGGEDGDGFEAGQANENAVHSLILYFLDGDANSKVETPILGSLKIEKADIIQEEEVPNASITTDPVQIPATLEEKIEFDKTYGILAVTNVKNPSKAETLGELREEIYKDGAFGDEKAGDFIMSSERIGNIKFSKYNNSENNPATARILVERLAARIDFKQTRVDGQTVDNVYPIYVLDEKDEPTDEIMAKVTLEELLIVNQMHNNTYTYKRVADDVENLSNLEWLGLEKADFHQYQTNYVIDPLTQKKNGTWIVDEPENAPYFNRISEIKNVGDFYKEATDGINKFVIVDGAYDKLGNYATVGYTEENTTDKEYQINGYSTGVIFKGTAKVLKAYDRNITGLAGFAGDYIDKIEFVDLNEDEEFYIYEDRPYKNLETIVQRSVIRADNSGNVANGWYFDREDVQNALGNATTKEDLQTYISSFADNSANLGYRKYMEDLLATVDGETYENIALKMKWSVYKEKLNAEDFDFSKYSVRKSENQEMACYYPYWIKHSDNEDPREMGIMEFGIVRNNIYKLAVNKINNFGIFELDPNAPDEPEELWMDVELQVKDWVLRYNDNIEL